MMGGKMHQKRQTSARLIIAAVVLVLQLLTLLLPVTECVQAYGGDSQLNAIYFNVLMSEGLDVNAQLKVLQKALDRVRYYMEQRGAGPDERIEHQLAQVLTLIHHNLVGLPLSNKTRTQMYEQMLRVVHSIIAMER
ncbi:uncharacterized protein LOC109409791 [Aedes albopictus]|uniref:Secreted protein n=1 Tax=Aedes albopictus TaxID=7160 RepID=A0ABM1XK27_AEDAL|nr:uncharacterized protein LOC109409791 [Aedes albopictus]